MANPRDPERTRRAIVVAARDEFSAHGRSGARVDRIAAGARVNKRMLYHYFGNKDGLWTAVLADQLGGDPAMPPTSTESLAERLAAASRRIAERPDITRLLAWEALSTGSEDVVVGPDRALVWQSRVAQLRDAQQQGRISDRIEPAQLELALAALVLFPFAFPQLARMITGQRIADPAFARDQAAFFGVLSKLLEPSPPAEATGREVAPKRKPRLRLTATVTEI